MGGWEGDSFIGEASLSLPRSKDRRKKNKSETLESAVVQQGFGYSYSNAPGKNISEYDKKMKKAKGQPILNNIGTISYRQKMMWELPILRNFRGLSHQTIEGTESRVLIF